jgi:BMFP domain-containing protein YqiC
MQSENPFLDQVAKFVTNAAGAAKGVRDEIATLVKSGSERFANDLDLVPREEFEAMKAVALKARSEIETLKARVKGDEGLVRRGNRVAQWRKSAYPQPIPKGETSPLTRPHETHVRGAVTLARDSTFGARSDSWVLLRVGRLHLVPSCVSNRP